MAATLTFAAITGGFEHGPRGLTVGPIADVVRLPLGNAADLVLVLRGWKHSADPVRLGINVLRPNGTSAPYRSPDLDDPIRLYSTPADIDWWEVSPTLTLTFDLAGVWWVAVFVDDVERTRVPLLVDGGDRSN